MSEQFTFAKDAEPTDWIALPRAFKAGEVVHRFRGYDYGLVRDDMQFGGFETIACTLPEHDDKPPGARPFFTVPVAFLLRVDNGEQPRGDYRRIERSDP